MSLGRYGQPKMRLVTRWRWISIPCSTRLIMWYYLTAMRFWDWWNRSLRNRCTGHHSFTSGLNRYETAPLIQPLLSTVPYANMMPGCKALGRCVTEGVGLCTWSGLRVLVEVWTRSLFRLFYEPFCFTLFPRSWEFLLISFSIILRSTDTRELRGS